MDSKHPAQAADGMVSKSKQWKSSRLTPRTKAWTKIERVQRKLDVHMQICYLAIASRLHGEGMMLLPEYLEIGFRICQLIQFAKAFAWCQSSACEQACLDMPSCALPPHTTPSLATRIRFRHPYFGSNAFAFALHFVSISLKYASDIYFAFILHFACFFEATIFVSF